MPPRSKKAAAEETATTAVRRSGRTAAKAATEAMAHKAAAKKITAPATSSEAQKQKRGRPAKAQAESTARNDSVSAQAAEPKAKKARATKSAAKQTENKREEDTAAAASAGLVVGTVAPPFSVMNHDEQEVSLDDFAGKKVVIYFYPRDDTPGCTKEGKRFTVLHDEFESRNTVVLGVSTGKVAAHKKFRAKYGFPFALLADTNRDMIRAYGATKEGSKTQRSTVVLDEQGRIAKHWATVRGAEQHPDQVLDFIKSME